MCKVSKLEKNYLVFVQKKLILSYLFILAALLFIMSLSRSTTENMRGQFIAFLAPLWESIHSSKIILHQPASSNLATKDPCFIHQEEIQKLLLTNELLTNELLSLYKLLAAKQNLDETVQNSFHEKTLDSYITSPQYIQKLKQSIYLKTQALPARVIFRSMDLWNSSFWINVGEANNPSLFPIIVKNSPVMVGNCIVGVIDYVGQHQSRVCLITDPRLIISVRAARGGEQEAILYEHTLFLLKALNEKKDFALAHSDKDQLLQQLTKIKSVLNPYNKSLYLAKGELKGKIQPQGRTQSQILKGTGFNYDFSDEDGPARDLQTGKPIDNPEATPIPLLKVNDVLVTTGMDGIFPPNLKAAIVTKIDQLKEGDYFYELEAKPVLDLNNLSLVFVIPPISYDKSEIKN